MPTEPDATEAAPGSWRALVAGTDAETVLGLIDDIVERIPVAAVDGPDPASLSSGCAGIAVLRAVLHTTGRGPAADRDAWRCLDDAIEAVSTVGMGMSLYAGLTGVAWATELVGALLDPSGEDRNEAVDDAVARVLTRPDWDRAPYDVISGLVGLGVYSLERAPRPAALENIDRVVARLAERATIDAAGARWWTAPEILPPHQRLEHPSGGVDLGMAHGVAGVVGFLARVVAGGYASPVTAELLASASRWLIHTAAPGSQQPVPYFLDPHRPPASARSAWCYGDPGVSAALLLAARAAGEPAWEDAALAVARRGARLPLDESGVVDASFCHGSAGLAHLFNRIHQASGDETVGEAAAFWLRRTLAMCSNAASIDGRGTGAGSRPPWNGVGVLEGAAGIALVLLAAAAPVEPVWDRMFVLSGPEVSRVIDR